MKRFIPFLAVLAIFFTVSCAKKELASVDGRIFTAAELEKQMTKIDPAALQQYGENRIKETILNRMIETELLYRDLKEKKYDAKLSGEVMAALERSSLSGSGDPCRNRKRSKAMWR